MVELKRKGNTKIYSDSEHVMIVKYHNTEIVKKKWNGHIVLNSGGWKTYTTKQRMNQASTEFDLGYYVYQDKFEWFVDYGGLTLEFTDNMVLPKEIK